jgi:hypothetical protein
MQYAIVRGMLIRIDVVRDYLILETLETMSRSSPDGEH